MLKIFGNYNKIWKTLNKIARTISLLPTIFLYQYSYKVKKSRFSIIIIYKMVEDRNRVMLMKSVYKRKVEINRNNTC